MIVRRYDGPSLTTEELIAVAQRLDPADNTDRIRQSSVDLSDTGAEDLSGGWNA